MLAITLASCSGLLAGCVQNNTSNSSNNNETYSEISHSETDVTQHDRQARAVTKPSYTKNRFTTNTSPACPKLLQTQVDSSVITRNKEAMYDGQYCDYYIYPKKGQSLTITSRNSNIEVVLIMPKFYDFANGAYAIETNRRHVIRVKYNGIENMPDDFVYDINVNLV